MDMEIAIEMLSNYKDKKPSEIAEALDVLYQKFGSNKAVGQEIGKSSFFVESRRKILKLPMGILWKIDEGQIGIRQGGDISRLKKEEDQWLLALVVIETENLGQEECNSVVNLVLQSDKSIEEALRIISGISFDGLIEPLFIPMKFDVRLSVCKIAWEQNKEWEDYCYQFFRESIVDPSHEDVSEASEP